MKLLRNVTAVTAALTLSAGVFALPAIAQDGQNVAEHTAELDAADAPIQDEDRDYIATDGDDAAAVDALQEFADDAVEGELFNEQKPSETESPQTFDVEASQGQAVISELDIEEKMEGYRDAGKKVPLQETWMHRVYTHENADGAKDWLERVKGFNAYSPSMDFEVPLAVITPDGTFDEARPTVYMLNGAGGAEQGMDWITATTYSDLKDEENIIEFYQDKGVNVVIPQAGAFSYYTDWVESPENNYLWQENIKWETFLTKELPQALESTINGNGKRAIAGMSMSATSALVLAEHNPGFYDAVGSFSGCAATSRPFPNLFANLTVNRGGGVRKVVSTTCTTMDWSTQRSCVAPQCTSRQTLVCQA